ncbi:MAG TPA: hypothetical protein VNI52_05080 [Sphingobacteriaceae bacterium]|nr:hypothetical protein [Sphingobacteriaceae bacterium]
MVNGELNDKKVVDRIKKIKSINSKKVGFYPSPANDMISWFKNIQEKFLIEPYIKFSSPDAFVNQVHYKQGEKDIFFIANYNTGKPYSGKIRFSIKNKAAYVWNPENGDKYILDLLTDQQYDLNLGAGESKLIVFEKANKGNRITIPKTTQAYQIKERWNLQLQHINGEKSNIESINLVDFKNNQIVKSFAGTISYKTSVQVNNFKDYNYLDLGEIYGVSELMVNDVSLGVKWYGQHRYNLQNALRKGRNEIRITVTSGVGNYTKSLKENKVAQRWTATQELQSIGIMGPVTLL